MVRDEKQRISKVRAGRKGGKASSKTQAKLWSSSSASSPTSSSTSTSSEEEILGMGVRVINRLNELAGTKFKPESIGNQKHLNARFKEGFTEKDFIAVVEKMVPEWKDDAKMHKYLRPQTLFNSEKFEGYLNRPTKMTDRARRIAEIEKIKETHG